VLCPLLRQSGFAVRMALRSPQKGPAGSKDCVVVGEIDGDSEWAPALGGIDVVIHLAARAHVLNDQPDGPRLYQRTNAHGTSRLAQESARHGVRRLIYLSSVKVNGEETTGRAFSAEGVPQPRDAYGLSKWQGEQLLAQAAAATGMQIAVIRSPLVYGAGVRANFLRLLQSVDEQRLLPLGGIRNRRSLVSVWNLCDLLVRLIEHPGGAGTWMVSDGLDLSTPELVQRIARAMGRRARLLSVPAPLLRLAGDVLGRGAEMRRLCGSLTVDITPTRQRLSWSPPLPIDDALLRTVSWYLSRPQLAA
jgi:nucleoside-diphosphate-sugar epimerase